MRISFVFLSLLLMSFDVLTSFLTVDKVYGGVVLSIFLRPQILIPYLIMVFLVEYAIVSGIYKAFTKLLKVIREKVYLDK